jgi:hypothetical protein
MPNQAGTARARGEYCAHRRIPSNMPHPAKPQHSQPYPAERTPTQPQNARSSVRSSRAHDLQRMVTPLTRRNLPPQTDIACLRQPGTVHHVSLVDVAKHPPISAKMRYPGSGDGPSGVSSTQALICPQRRRRQPLTAGRRPRVPRVAHLGRGGGAEEVCAPLARATPPSTPGPPPPIGHLSTPDGHCCRGTLKAARGGVAGA